MLEQQGLLEDEKRSREEEAAKRAGLEQRVADGVLCLKSKELVEDILGKECGLLDDKVYDIVRDALGKDENLRDVGNDADKVTILTRMTLDEAVKALLEEFDGLLDSDAAEMCFEFKDQSIVEMSDPPVLRAAAAAAPAAANTAMKTRSFASCIQKYLQYYDAKVKIST